MSNLKSAGSVFEKTITKANWSVHLNRERKLLYWVMPAWLTGRVRKGMLTLKLYRVKRPPSINVSLTLRRRTKNNTNCGKRIVKKERQTEDRERLLRSI